MSRVLAVSQHVQDVGLAAVAELVHVLLLAGKRQDVVCGSQHKGGLEISHDLLPDCPLHGQVPLYVLYVLLSERLAAPPLLQGLVQDPLTLPPLLVLVTFLVIFNSLSPLMKER